MKKIFPVAILVLVFYLSWIAYDHEAAVSESTAVHDLATERDMRFKLDRQLAAQKTEFEARQASQQQMLTTLLPDHKKEIDLIFAPPAPPADPAKPQVEKTEKTEEKK